MNNLVSYIDFKKIDVRVGTIISAQINNKLDKPSIILKIDFGKEIGIKKSSAQLISNYNKEKLINKQIAAVLNFEPKQIGNLISDLCYAIIDQAGDLGVIVIDIIETPYLIVGWAGFLCLFAVGLASFNSFQEWFNKNRSTISGLVYTAALLGVWHFYWQEKVISYEAVFHSVLMTLLIVWRLRISTGKSPS